MKRNRPSPWLAEEVDTSLEAGDHFEAFDKYRGIWIRTTRYALGWVAADLASELKMSKQSISLLEARENRGSVTIRKLRHVAEAMNCRLAYGFVPDEPMKTTADDLYRRQAEARQHHRAMPRPRRTLDGSVVDFSG